MCNIQWAKGLTKQKYTDTDTAVHRGVAPAAVAHTLLQRKALTAAIFLPLLVAEAGHDLLTVVCGAPLLLT